MKQQHTITLLFTAIMMVFSAGCNTGETDAFEVSSITISNIPQTIPAFSGSPAAPAFKVYLYASDYLTNQNPAKAKGVVKVTPDMLQNNGTYTVTIPLRRTSEIFKPDPNYDPNPNIDHGSWSGTSNLFTLVLSPQDTLEHGQLSLWMKGGYDLDIDKKNMDWNGLLNFRLRLPVEDFAQREWEFYHDNVCWDPEITTHATYLDPPHRCNLDTSKHWTDYE